jgi:hypothetical protein
MADDISQKFADLHAGLERFDFNYGLSRDPVAYDRAEAQYEELAVLLQECVAIDKDTTDAICSNLIPTYAKPTFDRFLTGEYLDITELAVKDKIREFHNLDMLNHSFNVVVVATTMGDGQIIARSFARHDDTKMLVRCWVPSLDLYRTKAEFDHALAFDHPRALGQTNPPTLVTLDKKRYVLPDRLSVAPVSTAQTLSAKPTPKPNMEMGL